MAEVTDRVVAPTIQRRTRAATAGRSELRQQRSVGTHPRPVMPDKTVRSAELGASKVSLDRPLHAAVARFTLGISPAALSQAYIDWLQHIVFSPDKQFALAEMVARQWARHLEYCRSACADPNCQHCVEPLPQDKRFAGEAWQRWPFNAIYEGFLLGQEWWHTATTGIEGVSKHHEDVASFVARQFFDVFSPVNFPLTNPEVFEATIEQGGMNLLRGTANLWEDWRRILSGEKPVGV